MAPLTQTSMTARVLADIPGYYEKERHALAVVDALCRELERIEATIALFLTGFFPQNATDVYRLLDIWEAMLGLPVAPAGATLSQRQASVLATIRSRKSGSGAAWIENVSVILGSGVWDYEENSPGDYNIAIILPFGAGLLTSDAALALLRQITPAHLGVTPTYAQGFVTDISQIDKESI